MARRPPERRDRPFWWGALELSNPIFPVVGVTWFEAQAYCNWLSTQLQALDIGDGRQVPIPEDYRVRLPTEDEWERAVRGTDGREYPWGDVFEAWRANTRESNAEGSFGGTITLPSILSPKAQKKGQLYCYDKNSSIMITYRPFEIEKASL